jgi:hypothetical protein
MFLEHNKEEVLLKDEYHNASLYNDERSRSGHQRKFEIQGQNSDIQMLPFDFESKSLLFLHCVQ